MKPFILILALFTFGFSSYAQPGDDDKSGTISIGKEKATISGLYKKTNVVYNLDISDAQSKINENSSAGAVNSQMHFYFLPSGRLYQIDSELSTKKILDLAKNDPTKLRPVLASWEIQDSLVFILPLQQGINDEMEPSKAYYEGGLLNNRLFLTKKHAREVFIFEKQEE